MVDGLAEMHHGKFRASTAELVMGQGRFTGPRTIEVARAAGGTRVLHGTTVVSTGSRATVDGTPGLREAHPLIQFYAESKRDRDRMSGTSQIIYRITIPMTADRKKWFPWWCG